MDISGMRIEELKREREKNGYRLLDWETQNVMLVK